MATWERKAALNYYDAVEQFAKANTNAVGAWGQLQPVAKRYLTASQRDGTSAPELHKIWRELCALCLDAGLCDCDASSPCSEHTCRLLHGASLSSPQSASNLLRPI